MVVRLANATSNCTQAPSSYINTRHWTTTGFIGGVLGLPSLLLWSDGSAHRKMVLTVIMLLAGLG